MKKLLSIFLVLMLMISVLPLNILGVTANAETNKVWTDVASKSFASGDGTVNNPYVIKTAKQLALLAKKVNEEILSGDYDGHYKTSHYILEKNINLAGYDWVTIGAWDMSKRGVTMSGFLGSFDGKGYTITNMHVKNGSDFPYAGLFGENRGTIKNLILKDAVIEFTSKVEPGKTVGGAGGGIYVGGIAADCFDGEVTNCIVDNIKIDVTAKKKSLDCGGALGGLNYGNMKYVQVSGEIKAKSGRAISVGGAIGDISNKVNVSNSSFTGEISSESKGFVSESATEKAYSYLHYVGGFCGDSGRANSKIKISNCYAIADINSKCDSGEGDAGLFAGAHGVVYNSQYKNLYGAGTVVINGKQYYPFWRGENSDLYSSKESSYTNCITVTNEAFIVDKKSLNSSVKTSRYNFNEWSNTDVFIDKLNFDQEIWNVTNDELPSFKYSHLHKTKEKYVKASFEKDGEYQEECTICGAIINKKKINQIKSAKLSQTERTYNGKKKSIDVTVKDSAKNVLKYGTDYTLSYKDNIKVGTATVTIKMKGKYTGSKKLTFKIIPKGTMLDKIVVSKKSFKIYIKKQSSQTTGYEIQYSTSSKFSSKYTKTKKIKSYKTTLVTLKNLKAKKDYYMRVRTYKTVNGKKYYSDWSITYLRKTK